MTYHHLICDQLGAYGRFVSRLIELGHENLLFIPPAFMPRGIMPGVYNFRLSVCMFVCSFVRSYFLLSRGICVKVLR